MVDNNWQTMGNIGSVIEKMVSAFGTYVQEHPQTANDNDRSSSRENMNRRSASGNNDGSVSAYGSASAQSVMSQPTVLQTTQVSETQQIGTELNGVLSTTGHVGNTNSGRDISISSGGTQLATQLTVYSPSNPAPEPTTVPQVVSDTNQSSAYINTTPASITPASANAIYRMPNALMTAQTPAEMSARHEAAMARMQLQFPQPPQQTYNRPLPAMPTVHINSRPQYQMPTPQMPQIRSNPLPYPSYIPQQNNISTPRISYQPPSFDRGSQMPEYNIPSFNMRTNMSMPNISNMFRGRGR